MSEGSGTFRTSRPTRASSGLAALAADAQRSPAPLWVECCDRCRLGRSCRSERARGVAGYEHTVWGEGVDMRLAPQRTTRTLWERHRAGSLIPDAEPHPIAANAAAIRSHQPPA